MSKIIAGLDIGNGYVKGSIYGDNLVAVDVPSCVAYVTNTHNLKEHEIDSVMSHIFNELDVSFESPLINDSYRRLFGIRGLQSGKAVEEFDVYSHISKAKQPLTIMLTLGCLAGKVLQDYWNKHHKLPDTQLKADVRIALALPIGEFMKYRKTYAEGYKASNHVVCIHNFEQVIKVEIHFEDVQVIAEGQAAQKAINAKGVQFMEAMLTEVRRMGEPLTGVKAEDILAVENTVGVDIGEGTTNFPVYINGKFNPDASVTFNKGYGSVLNAALERLQDMGYPFNSRKALQDYLNRPPVVNKDTYRIVQDIVDEEITAFVMDVSFQFANVMRKVGAYIEVVYVYGGGATPVRNELYPALIDKAKSFAAGVLAYPILYLDSNFSRWLNQEGLYVIADSYAKASKQ